MATPQSIARAAKVNQPVGQKFGRLTVVRFLGMVRNDRTYECRCECGTVKTFVWNSIKRGKSRSCGCLLRDILPTIRRTHRHSGHKNRSTEYVIWCGIVKRCECKTNRAYKSYGGRGIRVCERWRKSFEAFLSDVGHRPSPRHSLDRHPNNDGDYEPGNVRWATRSQQARNTKKTRFLEFRGKRKALADWAEEFGLPVRCLYNRIVRAGWDIERALTTHPTRGGK